jgi:hypothetical protein
MTTTIERVSYAYVEHRGQAPVMRVHELDEDLRMYLSAHVDDLISRATGTAWPPARFVDDDAAARFVRLRSDSEATFTHASQELADRLVAEMDGRSGRGFLVTVQWRAEGEVGAAALKLDVTDKPGAALSEQEHGTATLEVVRNLLIELGRLQKGCVIPDTRPGSDAVIGDRQTKASLYFLRAMGLRQQEPAGQATLELVKIIAEVAPSAAGAAARSLARRAMMTVDDFLDEEPGLLTEDQRDEVLRRAQDRKRPIVDLDPGVRTMFTVIAADGITIRGPVDTIARRLSIEDRPDGARIVIDVSERPDLRYD